MIEIQAATVHLTRRDPARNMARFYRIALEPTLFDEVSLVRNWGRIGTAGQVRMETFDESGEAESAGAKLERVKRRKGYETGELRVGNHAGR